MKIGLTYFDVFRKTPQLKFMFNFGYQIMTVDLRYHKGLKRFYFSQREGVKIEIKG